MLNAAMWAKIAKAIIAVGAVAGIQIEPDQLELIAQGRGQSVGHPVRHRSTAESQGLTP